MHALPNPRLPAPITIWLRSKKLKPFDFQNLCWQHLLCGKSGLLNAPTGSGKTYALWLGCLAREFCHIESGLPPKKGLRVLWLTPLRALARDLKSAMQAVSEEMHLAWDVEIRTGDSSSKIKAKQRKTLPETLITTPESLHLLLAQKAWAHHFRSLDVVVVDEWHELLGSKRGIQVELALSRLRALRPNLITWGISATIGNLKEAADVLRGKTHPENWVFVKHEGKKRLELVSILPDEVERFPWTGHLGLNLLEKVVPEIEKAQSALLFTNTRSQAEIWYQKLLEYRPNWAGKMALHHGSLDAGVRRWVEDALHENRLKLVVCTSSLDLGVDFAPVDVVFQVGSPKGVARFLQRAGRSGHQPGAVSRIFFVPTHSLELVEGAALRHAIQHERLESRLLHQQPIDVLIQYLCTLALGGGFEPKTTFLEIKTAFSYRNLSPEVWQWILDFLIQGGKSLSKYDDYNRLHWQDSHLVMSDRRLSRRHRFSIGTIVSDPSLKVKLVRGGSIGTIEEYFVAKLKPGEVFWFGGRSLELVRIQNMTVYVRRAPQQKGIIPNWLGGRMPLSSQLSEVIRQKLGEWRHPDADVEIKTILPLLEKQEQRSALPSKDEFLIELSRSKDGHHVFFFPFEGRRVHEGLGALLAWRMSRLLPISFSIAMNDYGFELLSDQEIPLESALEKGLLSTINLNRDIEMSLNGSELARRRFREISRIAGLVFQGFPGQNIKMKHLQSSSQLLFDVFAEYEPDNLLYRQAFEETYRFQLERVRLRQALERIKRQTIVLRRTERFSPFAFPIVVDRLREKMSSETLEQRVLRLQKQLDKE